jgi:hypothetical protein
MVLLCVDGCDSARSDDNIVGNRARLRFRRIRRIARFVLQRLRMQTRCGQSQ